MAVWNGHKDPGEESEVLDMVSAKWDWNEAMRVSKEESYEEGKKDGKKEGEKEGGFSMLTDLVKEGLLSLSDAARKAGLSVDEFKKAAML